MSTEGDGADALVAVGVQRRRRHPRLRLPELGGGQGGPHSGRPLSRLRAGRIRGGDLGRSDGIHGFFATFTFIWQLSI